MNKIASFLALMISWSVMSVAIAETYTPGQKVNKDFANFAKPFLATHCVAWHDETEPEGNLSLHNLGTVDEVNAGIWESVWAQVTLKGDAAQR